MRQYLWTWMLLGGARASPAMLSRGLNDFAVRSVAVVKRASTPTRTAHAQDGGPRANTGSGANSLAGSTSDDFPERH